MTGFMEGADKRFVIPVYQRKYDWKLDNCRQLFDDLIKIVQDSRSSHFFGSIVSSVVPNGSKIEYKKYEYYLFNKPSGCVSATKDNVHETVMDYITDAVHDDLFPVGRLDIDTEGLLLITNDGALSHELLSPSKHVAKTYYARIDGEVTWDDIIRFKEGIDIGEERPTKPAELVIKKSGSVSEIELTITEGKFHQVKRMFEALGKRVIYLKRISMGPLKLPDDLKTGTYRALTQAETDALMQINSGK